MTTHQTRYDLVFFGIDRQGPERTEALIKLAQWMNVAPDQLAPVLEQRRRVIASDLDEAAGAETQRQVIALGIRCNLRPHVAYDVSLDLAPLEAPPTVIVCPACGHYHNVKANQPPPAACEKCGIVFAKYEKVAQEKKERELVRQSLLSDQQRRQDQEQKEREERLAQERRRKLEDEIRKELGLPRMVRSRASLLGSAAGIYCLGLVMGAGGLVGYDLLFGSGGTIAAQPRPFGVGALAGQGAADFGESGFGASGAGASNPGMAAQVQVAALLAAAASGAAATESGDGAAPRGGDAATLSSQSGQLVNAATAGSSRQHGQGAAVASATASDTAGFLSNQLADLKKDTEWDLYILGRMDALREQHATARAIALVDHLRNPELRFDRGAWLADTLWNDGQLADAERLYQSLMAAADREPDTAGARVAALCTLARHLNRVGRPADADLLLRQAKTIAEAVTGPADKIAADSEIGALLTNLGRPQDARVYFTGATQGLGRIPVPADRLAAIPGLARGFAKAGFRTSALNFLEEATKNIESVNGPQERARILGVIAETTAHLGDIQAAKGAAARIAGPLNKDRTVYHIIADQIVSDRLANAMDVSEGLQTPTYQALAAGLLGLQQQRHPAYRPLAAQSSEKAIAAIAALTDPAQKSVISAEIARLAVRGGDPKTADGYFAQARQLAEAIPSVPERDRALAILATNEALALRLGDARQKLAKISDTPLRLALTNDLSGLDQLVGTVP
ncbi:tetratricopeptide repeat protein [uncultured Thiodictyon sp.]|uniref:tetratricopeptide repeat protein n=1 Tax=uncultured Thiodictyon sp. TaxID=1846217 RepID=UPI0025CB938F|nr:tetratricopeptide repeat protein [uncultured Thiodictyon sp.]